MKQIFEFLIRCYQIVFSVLIKQLLGISSQCRYEVTCSEYAKRTISRYGVLKGSKLALVRILHCQPFTKHI